MSASQLDETDRRIIEALQHDGRASYAELAELVTLSPAATRLRVQRLLDSGVVKVVGVTDPLALGYPVMAALGVRVERNVRDVADRIADIDGVIYVVFTSGSFDLLVEVLCEDSARLLNVIDDEVRATVGTVVCTGAGGGVQWSDLLSSDDRDLEPAFGPDDVATRRDT